jgi:peptide/nickel transport system substrate-binding protein
VDEPPRNAEPAEESQVSQVQQGGTARILLPEVPACLNPYLPECEGAEALIGTVLEAPLAVGPTLEYRPFLAERMPSYDAGTLSLEPLTVELRLREGVTFSDGEPLTSADVKWTYERAARLAGAGSISPLYSGFGRLSRVETPDERTARLIFDEPYAHWRDVLTAPILPRHVYEGRDFEDLRLTLEPVGSGPFTLEDRTETGMSLVENREYWVEEPPLPNLEGIEISTPTPGEAAGSLSEGRADFGFFATTRALPDSGGLLRAAAAPVRVETLLFNSRRLDETTRQEISRAAGRERIAGESGAPVAQSFVPPKFVPGYIPAWEDYSPPGSQGAQTTGGTLDLVYPREPGNPVREEVVADLASDLSGAGIEVEPHPVPSAELFGEVLPDGDFDLALVTAGPPAAYEILLPSLPPDSREALARSLETLDAEERAQTLRRAQERMSEQGAVLPLFVWPDTMAWSSTLTGPRPDTPYRGLMSNAREWAFYK